VTVLIPWSRVVAVSERRRPDANAVANVVVHDRSYNDQLTIAKQSSSIRKQDTMKLSFLLFLPVAMAAAHLRAASDELQAEFHPAQVRASLGKNRALAAEFKQDWKREIKLMDRKLMSGHHKMIHAAANRKLDTGKLQQATLHLQDQIQKIQLHN